MKSFNAGRPSGIGFATLLWHSMVVLFFISVSLTALAGNQDLVLKSPDKEIVLNVMADDHFDNAACHYSISYKGKTVLSSSAIAISFDQFEFNQDFILNSIERSKHNDSWENAFGEKRQVPDRYRELKVNFEDKTNTKRKVNLIFRVYNEGVALSYSIPNAALGDSILIKDENIRFSFMEDYITWATYRAQGEYEKTPISRVKPECERPLVVEQSSQMIAIAEAKLVDYARMKLSPDNSRPFSLRTQLAGTVKKSLPFQSPWRVIMIGDNAGDLLQKNYLILNLNDPCAIKDISWIRPGKVIREVTLTTQGGLACVDFAATHGLQYVEFDAGWYGPEGDPDSDASTITVDPKRSAGPLDLHHIIEYGKSRGIGIILYVNHLALEKKIDQLLPLYESWGIKGLKYGFVNVGSQHWTSWLHEAVRKAAAHHLMVDIHDEYRPTGYSRTYPNLMTQEGIRGDEESITNDHTLISMFTRLLAGAGDNTICYYAPRVTEKMGSHASQLAKSIMLFSPWEFLFWYDRPEGSPGKVGGAGSSEGIIGDEPELEFFKEIPTVWDETRVLDSKIGEYALIARRKGGEWFVGGMTGSAGRRMDLDLSFLNKHKKYEAKIYQDDPSADTRTFVSIQKMELEADSNYAINLESRQGFVMTIFPQD